ncbi:hypothetical protein HYH03_004318 [Edaphochlamys debaryana]|uniref:Uncharacterized protein n=1 Tax=Edaphochlamys debaryana TaxID=47281 RepID=A0A835Y9S0_9CHLO|nr:hypothetical protein HYH03_004318 [Edaphochlamys debaryana]|eukprot:KAG2497572.1 hypothetical protein HYH03_004318 [Edaphochlamys debaryana]
MEQGWASGTAILSFAQPLHEPLAVKEPARSVRPGQTYGLWASVAPELGLLGGVGAAHGQNQRPPGAAAPQQRHDDSPTGLLEEEPYPVAPLSPTAAADAAAAAAAAAGAPGYGSSTSGGEALPGGGSAGDSDGDDAGMGSTSSGGSGGGGGIKRRLESSPPAAKRSRSSAVLRRKCGTQGVAKLVQTSTRLYIGVGQVREWLGEVEERRQLDVKVMLGDRLQPTPHRGELMYNKAAHYYWVTGTSLRKAAKGKWFMGWRHTPDDGLVLLLRSPRDPGVRAARAGGVRLANEAPALGPTAAQQAWLVPTGPTEDASSGGGRSSADWADEDGAPSPRQAAAAGGAVRSSSGARAWLSPAGGAEVHPPASPADRALAHPPVEPSSACSVLDLSRPRAGALLVSSSSLWAAKAPAALRTVEDAAGRAGITAPLAPPGRHSRGLAEAPAAGGGDSATRGGGGLDVIRRLPHAHGSLLLPPSRWEAAAVQAPELLGLDAPGSGAQRRQAQAPYNPPPLLMSGGGAAAAGGGGNGGGGSRDGGTPLPSAAGFVSGLHQQVVDLASLLTCASGAGRRGALAQERGSGSSGVALRRRCCAHGGPAAVDGGSGPHARCSGAAGAPQFEGYGGGGSRPPLPGQAMDRPAPPEQSVATGATSATELIPIPLPPHIADLLPPEQLPAGVLVRFRMGSGPPIEEAICCRVRAASETDARVLCDLPAELLLRWELGGWSSLRDGSLLIGLRSVTRRAAPVTW